MVRGAREAVAARWEAELNYYRNASLPFTSEARRREFFAQAERALEELRRPYRLRSKELQAEGKTGSSY